ncbi:MAG: UDP-N-acetylmuramoyl-L-alanine--D-glutamate ligase [Firmicutes bacterium]|nr:UDP-N-acetylmuramoyl-L-alanine--D-glutamate ligase [Bacillota bacterium]
MKIKNKKILVLGLGISGISTAKALTKMGANVIINDSKSKEQLKEQLKDIKDINATFYLGTNSIDLNDIDLIIKSPGVPLDVDIIKEAKDNNIEVITDIELAYRISSNNFIAITGTNGKTTTTTLVGEIFENSNRNCHVTGNIGVGILWELVNSKEDESFIIETSSFQLESIKTFKPNTSVIINVTPDHIKWHKNFENYFNAKKKVFLNQDNKDYTILNYDDPLLKNLDDEIKSNVLYFSQKEELKKGIYIKDENIVINDGKNIKTVMKYRDIKIPGKHNLENALAAVAVAWVNDIDIDVIKNSLNNFEGVEHRLEYVDNVNGVNYYNDSKGTNPNASMKALEALNKPIILIAGGYDKGSEFKEFIEAFNGKVKSLILLGETKEIIKKTAKKLGYNDIYLVKDMDDAVKKASLVSERGDNVLLSPACASWDMYSSYEQRGKDFKKCVYNLRRI